MANILVVDDEKYLAEIINIFLEFKGYKVKTATDGYKTIEEVKATHYDLVLMDIRLPGINGVEVFLKIKEIDPKTRVIMMTGFSVEDLVEQALREGDYACLHKPFNMEGLLEEIEKVLKEKQEDYSHR